MKIEMVFFASLVSLYIIACTAFAQTLQSQVTFSTMDGFQFVRSNGIPNHETGSFPNRNNPNRISGQNHSFKFTRNPKMAARVTPLGMWPFGVAVNGLPFDPAAAEFWNRNRNSGWQYEAMGGGVDLGVDKSNAHVQPTGAYHYHGIPHALIRKLGGTYKPTRVGFAADGFPIYNQYCTEDPNDTDSAPKKIYASYRLKPGQRSGGPGGRHTGEFTQDYTYQIGLGDLDECNGHVGKTHEYPAGIYHYHLTETFPNIPRMFRGTPDDSFKRFGPPPGGGRGGPGDRRSGGINRPQRPPPPHLNRPPRPKPPTRP
jgi:hypothetical protein